jgi:hypothetical protein
VCSPPDLLSPRENVSEDVEKKTRSSEVTDQPVRLFYSYSHKDERHRTELEKYLSLLKRKRIIHDWSDRQISAGWEWEGDINENLKTVVSTFKPMRLRRPPA